MGFRVAGLRALGSQVFGFFLTLISGWGSYLEASGAAQARVVVSVLVEGLDA